MCYLRQTAAVKGNPLFKWKKKPKPQRNWLTCWNTDQRFRNKCEEKVATSNSASKKGFDSLRDSRKLQCCSWMTRMLLCPSSFHPSDCFVQTVCKKNHLHALKLSGSFSLQSNLFSPNQLGFDDFGRNKPGNQISNNVRSCQLTKPQNHHTVIVIDNQQTGFLHLMSDHGILCYGWVTSVPTSKPRSIVFPEQILEDEVP